MSEQQKPEEKKPTKALTLKIDAELHKALKRHSVDTDETMTELVEKALRGLLGIDPKQRLCAG